MELFVTCCNKKNQILQIFFTRAATNDYLYFSKTKLSHSYCLFWPKDIHFIINQQIFTWEAKTSVFTKKIMIVKVADFFSVDPLIDYWANFCSSFLHRAQSSQVFNLCTTVLWQERALCAPVKFISSVEKVTDQ